MATSALVLFRVSDNTSAQVVAVIGAFGSIVVYMLSEAYVDGQAVSSSKDSQAAG
ncbi:MAG TPA: hypothetical protein VN426_02620 [Syntrophomonadaceae bacterium]|nr:hypothetical protein [Syntrophomonadaceae bacterium]